MAWKMEVKLWYRWKAKIWEDFWRVWDCCRIAYGKLARALQRIRIKRHMGYGSNRIFFLTLPTKGHAWKTKKAEVGKRSKRKITSFFVSANGEKVGKSNVMWRSKKPQCFYRIGGAKKLSKSLTFLTQNPGCKSLLWKMFCKSLTVKWSVKTEKGYCFWIKRLCIQKPLLESAAT